MVFLIVIEHLYSVFKTFRGALDPSP